MGLKLIPRVLSAADLISSNVKEALEVSFNFMIPANENNLRPMCWRAGFNARKLK